MIDGSFNDIIVQSLQLQSSSKISFQRSNNIDICAQTDITQRVVGIATLVVGGNDAGEESIPLAQSEIFYQTP